MKLQVLSDFHLEFFPDPNLLVDSLDPKDVDILVVAGDCFADFSKKYWVEKIIKKYPHVISVLGNHEFYGKTPRATKQAYRRIRAANFHWLDNSEVIINGAHFLGGTLWFPEPKNLEAHNKFKWGMSDFHWIKNFEPWVYEENKACIEFLHKNITPESIVITHHLPTYDSVSDRYKTSTLNSYFVCDLEQLIIETKPKIWIHGHTHSSCDYQYYDTRIVCNPYGYYGKEAVDFERVFLEI